MLLDSNDIGLLSNLKVKFRSKTRNRSHMDFRSLDNGRSQEFNDYLPFTPGENIRHVDWNLYMRDSTLFTRQYEQLERPEVTIVPDLSASVSVSGKAGAVKRLAAAISFCFLNRGASVKLYSDGNLMRYFGRTGCERICSDIEQLPENKVKFLTLKKSASMMSDYVLVVSDLIFSEGFKQFKTNLNFGNKSCYLIALSNDLDRTPVLEGNLKLQDSQNGHTFSCCVDRDMIKLYQKCRSEYYFQIEKYSKRMNWQYKHIDVEGSLQDQMTTLAPAGTLFI